MGERSRFLIIYFSTCTTSTNLFVHSTYYSCTIYITLYTRTQCILRRAVRLYNITHYHFHTLHRFNFHLLRGARLYKESLGNLILHVAKSSKGQIWQYLPVGTAILNCRYSWRSSVPSLKLVIHILD